MQTLKGKLIKWACAVMAVCLLNTSCIGSFALFNRFSEWNRGLTGNKFVNAIIGFVLSPVYGLCVFADWVVLNTIEFWSGSSVLASVGETKNVIGSDDNSYVIVTEKDGYHITNKTTGDEMRMIYDAAQQCWSYEHEGVTSKMFRWNQDKTVTVFLQDGREITVDQTQDGLETVKKCLNQTMPFMVAR